jgi:hypothetical protein
MADEKIETSNMAMIADAMKSIMDGGKKEQKASRFERSKKTTGATPPGSNPATVKPMTVGRPSSIIANTPPKDAAPADEAAGRDQQRHGPVTNAPVSNAPTTNARGSNQGRAAKKTDTKKVEAKKVEAKTSSRKGKTQTETNSTASPSSPDKSATSDLSRLSGRLHMALDQIRQGKTSFSSPVVNTTLTPQMPSPIATGLAGEPTPDPAPELNPTEAALEAQKIVGAATDTGSDNAKEKKKSSDPRLIKTEAEFEKMRKQIHNALEKLNKDTAAKRKKIQDQLYQLEAVTAQNIADLTAKLDNFWDDAKARQIASDEQATIDQEKLASTRDFLSELNNPSPLDRTGQSDKLKK